MNTGWEMGGTGTVATSGGGAAPSLHATIWLAICVTAGMAFRSPW